MGGGCVLGDTDQGRESDRLCRLDKPFNRFRRVRGMLHVEQDPVEPGVRDHLDDGFARAVVLDPEHQFSRSQPPLQVR